MTAPPLSPRLAELLAVGSSSLTLGVAALARVADPLGRASFGDLAVAYRQDYLSLQQQTMGARAPEPGALSGDDVRTHLGNSVLPRLAELDIVALPPGALWSEAPVAFAMEVWVDMPEDRQPLIQQFLEAARRAVARDATTAASHARVGGASVLHAQHLVKAYKHRRVVNDVNIQLEQGEIVGLLGPNGAGKTTTFYMIDGSDPRRRGKHRPRRAGHHHEPMYKRARMGLGYLAQEPSVFRKLTVEENILAILEMLPLSEAERATRLERCSRSSASSTCDARRPISSRAASGAASRSRARSSRNRSS